MARTCGRERLAVAHHLAQRRSREQLEADERRHRVAGEPEHGGALHHREAERLRGLDRHLVPVDARIAARIVGRDALQCVAHVVEVAHRHPAARDDRVAAVHRVAQRRGHEHLVVVRRAEIDRVGAGTGELREQHRPIGVADLPRRERPRLDELVAGREHADARTRIAAHAAGVDRRQHPDACSGQHLPGLEDHVAGLEVAAGAAHVPTGLDLQGHGDAVVAVARGALHHHDAVGTIGHRGAGHDPDRLSRSDRDGRARARRRAPRPPGAAPGAPRWHRWCRWPAPRSRPSRCWGTAEPPRARSPARRGRARGRRPGRPRSARGGAPPRGPRPGPRPEASRQAVAHEARGGSRPDRGRGRAGRGRARCWPAGSRASARCRSDRA